MQRPGYYWLAYEWRNLLFSCEICNQAYKRNEFPLEDPEAWVHNHHGAAELDRERPLLLNPAVDDPQEHITFEDANIVGKTQRGSETIRICGLGDDADRAQLEEDRRECLANVSRARLLASFDDPEILERYRNTHSASQYQALMTAIPECIAFLNKAARSDHRFAGMIRANFPDLPTT